jgi:hydrogenase maturation protease
MSDEKNGRTLVAGVGNIFLGDDGFGVEVARRLATKALPDGVEVADFGIRGVHLAYQLLDGYDLLVLIDALPHGEAPGTVYVFEPDPAADGELTAAAALDAHGMQPDLVLGLLGVLNGAQERYDRGESARGSGGTVGRVLVVGCEPAQTEDGIGLSKPVADAVDEAARVVLGLVGAGGDGDG